jgi:hypothetical protein
MSLPRKRSLQNVVHQKYNAPQIHTPTFYTPMSSIYKTIAPITAATITPKMPAWTLLPPLVN